VLSARQSSIRRDMGCVFVATTTMFIMKLGSMFIMKLGSKVGPSATGSSWFSPCILHSLNYTLSHQRIKKQPNSLIFYALPLPVFSLHCR
jgi:hypothetical protein